MYIVIVGGGKIGYYLAKTLLSYRHKVVIIDPVKEACEKIANELNIPVINGDGTSIDKLSELEMGKADVFIAVIGRDEDNLIACQLAKLNYGVKKTITRVNNPKNISVFEKLGVDITLSSTSIIADLIEQEVDYEGMKTLIKLKNGKIILSEIIVSDKSPLNNQSLTDIDLPEDCIIISVIREEEIIIPKGQTILYEGDVVIIASSQHNQHELRNYLKGK
jgi:trk system potassium uptake protein